MTQLRIAGAPITWGICEVPGWGHQLAPERVLCEMRALGLTATELGPEGYLPAEPDDLNAFLDSAGFQLVGGFVPVVLHREDVWAAELARATRAADLLASCRAEVLVIAAALGTTGYDRRAELDAAGWTTLVRSIDRIVETGAERGLTIVLHPHHGTVVDRRVHVERLLELSSVGLCLDTGHLFLGGADPVDIVRAAGDRIAHVHLKDIAADVARQVSSGTLDYRDAVRHGLYRPLGAGDAGVAETVRSLEASGYRGWYVLEQDRVVDRSADNGRGPMRDAEQSVAFLERITGGTHRALAKAELEGSAARDAAGGGRSVDESS
jgi:inosose dehydratase